MAERHSFVRTLTGLAPADEDARKYLLKYKLGETLAGEILKPREHRSLKRYWSLVNIILQNTDQFKSKRELHGYLKLRSGHVIVITNPSGEVFKLPDSIDYASIDETEWMEVFRRITDVVLDEILPGIDRADLELEIQRLCGVAS